MAYSDFEGFQDVESDRSELKDVRGVQKTESLFNETIQGVSRVNYTPLYSLRDYDHKGFISAYQIYMASVDEREAALKLVGSMGHWRKLCNLEWFMRGRSECQFEGLENWRKDMADRDASLAKKTIIAEVRLGNVSAARALDTMSSKTKKGQSSQTKNSKKKPTSSDTNITDFLSRHTRK